MFNRSIIAERAAWPRRPTSMDMRIQLSSVFLVDAAFSMPASEYARLAEYRRQVFMLIGDYYRAISQPDGLQDALRILSAILPCSDAYFSMIESMLDKISAASAAPHREVHRRILLELKETLNRHTAPGSEPIRTDLIHALDSLVMHDAAIRLRESSSRA